MNSRSSNSMQVSNYRKRYKTQGEQEASACFAPFHLFKNKYVQSRGFEPLSSNFAVEQTIPLRYRNCYEVV